MKLFVYWVVATLLISNSLAVYANTTQEIERDSTQKLRPIIGVVLAGGGAKGAAHIGVLKALEEMQIPVDIITGTSMGAYVGGLYATGMSADEIASFIYTVDWKDGYVDRVDRSQRKVRDKENEDRYQIRTDLGLHLTSVEAPKSVVQGQNMLRILRQTTGNLPAFQSFDDLAIQYRAVATDILKLKPVIIDKGHLVDAMMASMSVPGVLPPYELNGNLLVDGGVTNNMPVELAKSMGADIVIAVDISSDYKTREDFNSVFTVGEQLSNYLVRRSTEDQILALEEQDVYLHPEVGQISTTDFVRMPEAYDLGYDFAVSHTDELRHLSVDSSLFQAYIDHKQAVRRTLKYGDETKVDQIIVNNHSHYSDELIKERLGLSANQIFKTKDIEKHVEELYALDRFELITYQYEQGEQQTSLVVNVEEKSWGPNYMDFRFFLEEDFDTNSFYALGATTNFTDINNRGGELRLNIEFGTDKRVEAEFYSPLFLHQDLFSLFGVTYTNERRNVLCQLSEDKDSCLEPALKGNSDFMPFSHQNWQGDAAIGYQPTLWQMFTFGLRFSKGESSLTSLPSAGGLDFERKGIFVNYQLDTLDNYTLPTKGWYLNAEYLLSHDVGEGNISDEYDSNDNASEFTFETKYAHTHGRNTLVASIDYGIIETEDNSLPVNPRELGGFLNLSGVPRGSLVAQNKAFSSLVYRYRWFDNDFGMFKSPVYLGASVEYGGVWDGDDKLPGSDLFWASSLFAGIDSPVGPIMLSYGRVETGLESVYLIIGATY